MGAGPNPTLHSGRICLSQLPGAAAPPWCHTEHPCSWMGPKPRLVWDHPRNGTNPKKQEPRLFIPVVACCLAPALELVPRSTGGARKEGKNKLHPEQWLLESRQQLCFQVSILPVGACEKEGQPRVVGAKLPTPGRVGGAKQEVGTRAGWPWFLLGPPADFCSRMWGLTVHTCVPPASPLAPGLPCRAYPVQQYPCRTKAAAAIMHMIMNNLDPAVAQVTPGAPKWEQRCAIEL